MKINKIIGLFVICGLLAGTAPEAVAQEPTPTPKPPKDWQVRGVLAALNDELPGVQYEAVKKAVELDITNQIPDEEILKIIRLVKYDPYNVSRLPSAARLLGRLGKRVMPHLPELIHLATESNSSARIQAISALGEMNTYAKTAAPKLLELLADENWAVRAAAVEVLGNLDDATNVTVPKLLELLADKDWSVRQAAAKALGRLGDAANAAVPQLIELLSDENPEVRAAAAAALGRLGDAANAAVPKLIELLSDENSDIQVATAWALDGLGDAANATVPKLIELLSDENSEVRRAAAVALGGRGDAANAAVPKLLELLADKDWWVQQSVAVALGRLDDAANAAVPKLLELLADENGMVRYAAAQALGVRGDAANTAVPQLIELLSNENPDVRAAAAATLGRLGDATNAAVPQLIELLSDKSSDVRQAAAQALSGLGDTANTAVPQLIKLLSDENSEVRRAAAVALGGRGNAAVPQLIELFADKDWMVRQVVADVLDRLGDAANTAVPQLTEMLSDKSSDVRQAAAQALSGLGDTANTAVPRLIELLSDENSEVRVAAVETLGKIGTDERSKISFMPFILDRTYAEIEVREERRFLAHFLGAGDLNIERLLLWLGKPASSPELNYNEARETLRVFEECWQYTQKFKETRTDLAEQIAVVATQRNIFWTPADLPLLQTLLIDLDDAKSTRAEALRGEIADIEKIQWGILALKIFGIHLSIWLILLLFYPVSAHVQALLWQPLFRNIAGCGYIPLLLTTLPFLKRYLFRPFRKVLLAEAALERFEAAHYFAEAEVAPPGLAAPQPLREAIPRLRGQSVLEGESGLGKTMFLRALLRRSRRPAVFLPAEKCVAGMVEAIHAKLPEHLRDRRFLRKLVGGGALDICVDGLNEVSADTRAAITQFVERAFTGNALLTTQPLEWQPPSTARVFALLPLRRDRIADYLLSRYALFAASAVAAQADYERACRAYLEKELAAAQPPELLASTLRILANPMDAVLVAQMLAHGQTPNLFRLQEQQCALMADDYARRHIGRTFPLAEFAERVYQMRLQDRAALPFDDFPDEIACMERHKMAVRRRATERTRPNAAAPTTFETRRLPFELNERIVKFLTDIPGIQAQAAQQAFVAGLRFDARLQGQISANCPPLQFFKTLVPLLTGYGQLDDGRDPLEAALQGAKDYLGKDRQADCDMLIKELRQIAVAASPRRGAPSPKSPAELWYFRHEKIMDYFLVQTFLGAPNERPRKHVSDSRFRGVYFQLAALLPLDEARALREMLIQYAADTKDHTVSDTFIQLLRPREMLSR